MRILVCISSVPDTTAKINFTTDGKSLEKNGVQFVINPYDEFCLNKAIEFQEKHNATITILTVGDASTEPIMRKALAIGANDGIRVDAEATDDFFVANQIANVAKNGNYDLILTGKESIDYNGGAVPGLVAAILDCGFINGCLELNILNDSTLEAVREIDNGKELVETNLPAVVAGQKGLVKDTEIRIPSMRGIMQARSKKIEVVNALPTENKIEIIKFEKPPSRASVKLIDKDNVAELVRLLHEEAKVI